MKNAPTFLVMVMISAAAFVAVADAVYRKDFMDLAKSFVVGYWAWLQVPKSE